MPRQVRPATWELSSDSGDYTYTLWTPTKTHDRWQAAWHSADGVLHDQTAGKTLARVLRIFPTHVGTRFRTVIENEYR